MPLSMAASTGKIQRFLAGYRHLPEPRIVGKHPLEEVCILRLLGFWLKSKMQLLASSRFSCRFARQSSV
jgi:hypothetical protein